MPAAGKRGPGTLVIFGGAMAAGVALAVGAAMILTGDGPRRPRRASTGDHASAAVPRRRRTPPPPAADAPPTTPEAAAPASPVGGQTSPPPTPPLPPQVTPPAADEPPAALALGPAVRDKKAEEDFFAKLRRESEERQAREAEARAEREANARAEREARDRAARQAKARAAKMKPVIEKNAQWHYLAGAHPRGNWTLHDYKPLGWKAGTAGFGYGDNDDRTVLNDMRYKYTVIYIRRTFDVADPADVKALELVVNYDDGFIAYLNGNEVVRACVGSGCGTKASGVVLHEAGKFERFDIKDPARLLRKGTNALAIEGHNVHDRSSDLTLDPCLEGLIESASP